MPSINALQDELKGRGFTILLVDIAEDLEKAAATVKERGYRLPVLLDTDGRTSHADRVIATPTVFLTGRYGALLGRAIAPRSWTKGTGAHPARSAAQGHRRPESSRGRAAAGLVKGAREGGGLSATHGFFATHKVVLRGFTVRGHPAASGLPDSARRSTAA